MKKVFQILFVIFLLLYWLVKMLSVEIETLEEIAPEDKFSCYEAEALDSSTWNKWHKRSWHEYTWNDDFCTNYIIANDSIQKAKAYRASIRVGYWTTDNEFWGAVYRKIYLKSRHSLTELQDSLVTIGKERNLNRDEFARMVVAFVQDIPYNYIMPKSCDGYDAHPCVENERFGILSPVEFLYRLQGDCDTRTVLLFTLLHNLGYDPVILNSEEYGHSMIGLDVPSNGEHLLYKGRRYAFWETTNTGWLPGMIPPTMKNIDYWSVVLHAEQL